jgi:hypothetical protein
VACDDQEMDQEMDQQMDREMDQVMGGDAVGGPAWPSWCDR